MQSSRCARFLDNGDRVWTWVSGAWFFFVERRHLGGVLAKVMIVAGAASLVGMQLSWWAA